MDWVGEEVPFDGEDEGDEEEAKSTASEDDRRAMSMFNVVFVMKAPLLEHNLRVKEMFEHVLKKFAKALKYEQARSNWVWRQSEMILNMKDRARDQSMFQYPSLMRFSLECVYPLTHRSIDTSMTTLWHQILSKSGLAKALSEVYLSISTSKIAHVFINEAFDVSLQIPQIANIADLPTAIEPQMPGVWLTTANSVENDESLDGITLARHFALLLLDDVNNILRDIDHEHGPKEVSHPLAEFVQIVKPTMSYVFRPLGLSCRNVSKFFKIPSNVPATQHLSTPHPIPVTPSDLLASSTCHTTTASAGHLHRVSERGHALFGVGDTSLRRSLSVATFAAKDAIHAVWSSARLCDHHPEQRSSGRIHGYLGLVDERRLGHAIEDICLGTCTAGDQGRRAAEDEDRRGTPECRAAAARRRKRGSETSNSYLVAFSIWV